MGDEWGMWVIGNRSSVLRAQEEGKVKKEEGKPVGRVCVGNHFCGSLVVMTVSVHYICGKIH